MLLGMMQEIASEWKMRKFNRKQTMFRKSLKNSWVKLFREDSLVALQAGQFLRSMISLMDTTCLDLKESTNHQPEDWSITWTQQLSIKRRSPLASPRVSTLRPTVYLQERHTLLRLKVVNCHMKSPRRVQTNSTTKFSIKILRSIELRREEDRSLNGPRDLFLRSSPALKKRWFRELLKILACNIMVILRMPWLHRLWKENSWIWCKTKKLSWLVQITLHFCRSKFRNNKQKQPELEKTKSMKMRKKTSQWILE